jgi:hypothetical protein
MPEIDIDTLSELVVSREIQCDCPHLQEMVERVRSGQIPITQLKEILRTSLNTVI